MHCISETICFPVIEDRAKLCMAELALLHVDTAQCHKRRKKARHSHFDRRIALPDLLGKICRISGSEISMIYSC